MLTSKWTTPPPARRTHKGHAARVCVSDGSRDTAETQPRPPRPPRLARRHAQPTDPLNSTGSRGRGLPRRAAEAVQRLRARSGRTRGCRGRDGGRAAAAKDRGRDQDCGVEDTIGARGERGGDFGLPIARGGTKKGGGAGSVAAGHQRGGRARHWPAKPVRQTIANIRDCWTCFADCKLQVKQMRRRRAHTSSLRLSISEEATCCPL